MKRRILIALHKLALKTGVIRLFSDDRRMLWLCQSLVWSLEDLPLEDETEEMPA